jgi:hypothetical protein
MFQVHRRFGYSPSGQIFWAADDNHAKRRGQTQRNHVVGDELPHTDTGIEPLRCYVDKFPAFRNVQLDIGITHGERSKCRAEDKWKDGARNGKPQPSCRAPTKIACCHPCRRKRLICWCGVSQKACPRFGQAYASGCASEQNDSQPALKPTHCLTGCRGRDAQLRRRASKAAMAGNRQKHLDSVERTTANSEVLLHNQYRLSRIVPQEYSEYGCAS